MGPQPVGKMPDLRRLAGRAALTRGCPGPGRGRSWDSSFPPPWQTARPYICCTPAPGPVPLGSAAGSRSRAGWKEAPSRSRGVRPETGSVRPGPRPGNHGRRVNQISRHAFIMHSELRVL
jgi:hypothetical protein